MCASAQKGGNVASEMRTRLADLAEHAGVSTATVSRVLNARPGVSREARRAVLAALDVLGYERPERMRTRSSGLVGLVTPELTNPIFPQFAQAIEDRLIEHDFTTVLCTRTPGSPTEEDYLSTLFDHDVAGVIFLSGAHADITQSHEHYKRLRERGLPIALINGFVEGIEAPFFATDDALATELAVNHLLAMGHERLGLAIGPERYVPALRKKTSFVSAMEAAGLPSGHVASSMFTVEGGQVAASQLIRDGCTGIICASDMIALGAIRAARSLGRRVPADVSIVGYDDSTLMSFIDPPMTSVRQPVDAITRAATAALIGEIAGVRPMYAEMLFQPELVMRGTTGRAPNLDEVAATPAVR